VGGTDSGLSAPLTFLHLNFSVCRSSNSRLSTCFSISVCLASLGGYLTFTIYKICHQHFNWTDGLDGQDVGLSPEVGVSVSGTFFPGITWQLRSPLTFCNNNYLFSYKDKFLPILQVLMSIMIDLDEM